MATTTSQNLQAGKYVYIPPTLPTHLASIYDLKPIVDQPNDEEVQTIHAAIQAVNAEAQIPQLCNPILMLQLSQHLFGVQMAAYRRTYPLNVFPGENTYTPPSLPTHVPITLEPVVGSPSNEQLMAAQNALHVVESRGTGPLFDPGLNMQLSQHCFNLQFARYIEHSTLGEFTLKLDDPRRVPQLTNTQISQKGSSIPPFTRSEHTEIPSVVQPELSASHALAPSDAQPSVPEQVKPECPTLEVARLGETVNIIKELTSESKGILENINRVLIATQRSQAIVGDWKHCTNNHLNPVDQYGITAVERGLPQLRFYYSNDLHYFNYMKPEHVAGYLRFFGIGDDLIAGDGEPRLKEGKQNEGEKLLLKHLGLDYQR